MAQTDTEDEALLHLAKYVNSAVSNKLKSNCKKVASPKKAAATSRKLWRKGVLGRNAAAV